MSAVVVLFLSLVGALFVSMCHGACAEVDSDTEAVYGYGFKIGCISCKMRSEVEGTATIDWFFKAHGEIEFGHIYKFDEEGAATIDERFEDRLDWNGSKANMDIQDASIYLFNVTYNDSGIYKCQFNRILTYDFYEFSTTVTKEVHLTVVPKATRSTASIVSEVMMYVAIIGLQVWLFIEMVYCYGKISAAGEEALRESALVANAEYLAIASESKDNCAGVQVAE